MKGCVKVQGYVRAVLILGAALFLWRLMKASEAKTKVLHYWRFKRRYKWIATEAGPYNSDVLVSNLQEVVEVEIKVRASDLRAELKKRKHYAYKNGGRYIPNKFYIGVPEDLVETCIVLIEDRPYGIISIDSRPLTNKRKEVFCKIVRQARPINLNFPFPLYDCLLLRMGSELIQNRIRTDPDRIATTIHKMKAFIEKVRAIKSS